MSRSLTCAFCGKVNPIVGERVGRRDVCYACHGDLHACRQCHFYDPSAYNECREPSADRVVEKDRANFCDYYQPRSGEGPVPGKTDLFSAAEALFKKKD